MKSFKVIQIILAILSGALVMMYGEFDDSPGAQGIGLLTIISSLVIIFLPLIYKNKK